MRNLFFASILILILMAACPFERLFSENLKVTEMIVTETDTTFRYTFAYDDFGHKVLETQFFQQNSVWVRFKQIEYQYVDQLCVKQIERSYKNLIWVQQYVIDYVYENDLLVSELHTIYNDLEIIPFKKIELVYALTVLTNKKLYTWENNNWNLSELSEYLYFGDGRLQNSTITAYRAGTIVNQFKNDFSYDTNLRLSSQILSQKSMDGLSWLNLESINWLYAVNSATVISQRNKKWNADNSKWENSQRIDFEYDISNKLLSETYQSWNLMFWDDVVKYSYEYNAAAALVKTKVFLPIYNQWRCKRFVSYLNFNDNKSNLLESRFDFWGGTQNELVSCYIPFSFNDELTIKKAKSIDITRGVYTSIATAVDSQPFKLVDIYPNPSDGIFYINTHQDQLHYWMIYDLNGRLLKKSPAIALSNVVDLTELDAGIYFIKVVTNKTSVSLKLIKN